MGGVISSHGNLQVTHKPRTGGAVAVTTDTSASPWEQEEESARPWAAFCLARFSFLLFSEGFVVVE